MKMTIKTTTLQSMVSKAMKGASCNKMLPITGLMAIQVKDGVLTLITTDVTNYLYIREHVEIPEYFYVVVQADLFSKLVSRLTCEEVTMELKDDGTLHVTGNGSYVLELPLGEEGELITYPDPVEKEFDKLEKIEDINLSTIKLILGTAKASLAQTDEVPCYTGYYMGDSIVTTDTYKICGIDVSVFEKPVLLNANTMDLLDLLTDEHVDVYRNDNTIVFMTKGCVVYGKVMDNIEDFQIDTIGGLIGQEFESSCKVSKDTLLQLLDRLALFVSPYDKNSIYLTFTRNGLQVESKQSNSIELVPYMESANFKDFTCCIDIEMFRSQIKANVGTSVTIEYGDESAIKLVNGNVTQIVALLEDAK